MPKRVFAVTNIKLDSNTSFSAGEEVDHTKFDKKQLKELHDAGAIEVRTVDDETSSAASEEEEDEEQNATPDSE